MKSIQDRIKDNYKIDVSDVYSEEKLRDIVNLIWDDFLKENLLVVPLSPLALLDDFHEVLKSIPLEFKVLNVKESRLGEIGLVVKINWHDANELYLPDDLNEVKLLKTRFTPIGVYSINMKEGIVSSDYENAKMLAEELSLPLLSFNKKDYDSTFKEDYDLLVSNVICDYILKTIGKMDLLLRDRLIDKYGKFIVSSYKDKQNSHTFIDNEFLDMIFRHIDKNENIKGLKH